MKAVHVLCFCSPDADDPSDYCWENRVPLVIIPEDQSKNR